MQNNRIKEVRKNLFLSHEEFAKLINITCLNLINIENGKTNIPGKVIHNICITFQINEEWLYTGIGDMKNYSFSLDEYAKQKNLSNFQLNIIKGFMELDEELIHKLVKQFKQSFYHTQDKMTANFDSSIEKKVESYRLELEAEKKRGSIISFTKYRRNRKDKKQ